MKKTTSLPHIAARVIVKWTRRATLGRSPYLPYDPDLASWIAELGTERKQPAAAVSVSAAPKPYLPFDPEFERWVASLEPLNTAARATATA